MWGSLESPGISGFDLREAIGQLTEGIMTGAVETPLAAASGEPLCTSSGAALTAHQTLRKQETYTDIPASIWPLIYHAISAEVESANRRNLDEISGMLMTGSLSSTLTAQNGAALSTSRGETMAAHKSVSTQNEVQASGLFADVALLFNRLSAYDTLADDIMGAILAGNIAATMANRAGQPLSTRWGESIKAYR